MKIGIVLFFSLNVLGQNFDLTDLFERATIDPLSCDSLLHYCTQTTNNQNTAYLAAGFMIKAKHLSSFYEKWYYFRKGRKLLDDIIFKQPTVVEYRWLRYCIQSKSPSILGYNNNLEEDCVYIKNNGTNYQKQSIKNLINEYCD